MCHSFHSVDDSKERSWRRHLGREVRDSSTWEIGFLSRPCLGSIGRMAARVHSLLHGFRAA